MNIHHPFPSRTIILTGLITIPITLILILFSPNTPALETSDPNFTVDNLNKIDSKRVSRTDYEYTYQADITNTGPDAENVTATVSSSSPGTTIVQDNLTFGDVATGTTATSSDTFTIRQNRRVPFDPDALGFEVDSTLIDDGLPPDPGEAGKATLEGIDSDGDGVRDDLQRWIALNFPDDPAIQAGLTQYILPLQQALIDAESEELALIHRNTRSLARRCLDAMLGIQQAYEYYTLLKAQTLNTMERSRAYIMYDKQLGGHVFSVPDFSINDCNFDPNNI
jgi:hypothetical protein